MESTFTGICGNLYVAAYIDDAYHETTLYFQAKKSQTINSYKHDANWQLNQGVVLQLRGRIPVRQTQVPPGHEGHQTQAHHT